MKRLTGIAGAILLEVMLNALCANLMFAVPGGFTGRTLLTSNSGCGGCHGSSPNTGVQAIITGPSSLAPGQTASYTIKVTVGVSTSTKAGVDIAVSDGTLAPVSSQLQLSSGEITHITRLVRGTEYTFNYTAPVSGGSVTIYATVAGDAGTWNWASNVVVTLPVQLSSFTGVTIGSTVQLDWQTISEINNYGFFVLHRHSDETNFSEVPNSFVAGHGTTNVPQRYRFSDAPARCGVIQYRLKQVDLDGSEYLTEPITVTMLTDVKEPTPRQFSLSQNYPNPFNSSTVIQFSVAQTGRSTLQVFNPLGRHVATLLDDATEAGNLYNVRFGGANLASGTYFYRLQNGGRVSLKKLVLLR